MIERPSLHALAVFLAVVEHGTMTSAAEAEGISQPAISAQIKVLERYYGTTLLQRTGRGVVLTPTGQVVANHARRILALVDELDRLVRDLESLKSGRLVIGASSTVGEQFLPAHLGSFHVAYPNVELEVRIGNTGEITAAVVGRELDFAFVAPSDPLLRDAPSDPASLSGRQFVLRERGSATRDLALHCLAAAGCEPAHVIELGSNEAVKRAVEAGLGIGLLSTHAIEAERLAELLVDLPLQCWECGRSFWLIRRRDRVLTRAEQAFLALLPQPARAP